MDESRYNEYNLQSQREQRKEVFLHLLSASTCFSIVGVPHTLAPSLRAVDLLDLVHLLSQSAALEPI